MALKDQGQLDEAIAAYRQAIALNPDYPEAPQQSASTPCTIIPATTPRAIAEEHRRWNLQHAAPLKQFIRPHANDRSPERRLRIGYVSPDFREHPVGRFLLPLLATTTQQSFEVFCLCPGAASPMP